MWYSTERARGTRGSRRLDGAVRDARQMDEQRKHIRIPTQVLIEFPNPSTMKTERSFTQDVSESGIRFPTPVFLQVGQQVPLTLHLPYPETTFQATGEVIWIRQISRLGAPQYDIGLRFCWIDDPDRRRLGHHLTMLLQHHP